MIYALLVEEKKNPLELHSFTILCKRTFACLRIIILTLFFRSMFEKFEILRKQWRSLNSDILRYVDKELWLLLLWHWYYSCSTPFRTYICWRNHQKVKSICKKTFTEEFEDTKGVIRIRKSKKNRQNNGQKKKDKQRSTKYIQKTKDRVTRTPQNICVTNDHGYIPLPCPFLTHDSSPGL